MFLKDIAVSPESSGKEAPRRALPTVLPWTPAAFLVAFHCAAQAYIGLFSLEPA